MSNNKYLVSFLIDKPGEYAIIKIDAGSNKKTSRATGAHQAQSPGELIKSYRDSKGWTQEEFAEKLQTTKKQVYKLERKKETQRIYKKQMEKLIKHLGDGFKLDIEEFYDLSFFDSLSEKKNS